MLFQLVNLVFCCLGWSPPSCNDQVESTCCRLVNILSLSQILVWVLWFILRRTY